jgi:Tfp pilus assembly protein FimT
MSKFVFRVIKEHHGISLAEVLIFFAVAAILTASAVPILRTMVSGTDADAAAQLIAQELTLARAMAVSTHGNILVQFDPSANSLVVAPGTGDIRGPFPMPGQMKFQNANPSSDTPDALGSKILGTGSNTQITFLDSGAAATDNTGTVLVSGTVFIERSNGDISTKRAITLLGGTGRIRIWKYDAVAGRWK